MDDLTKIRQFSHNTRRERKKIIDAMILLVNIKKSTQIIFINIPLTQKKNLK